MFPQIPQRDTAVLHNRTRAVTKAKPNSTSSGRLSVLQVATLNKPVAAGLGYGPIETIIYNIDKGLHASGHRTIVAASADSCVNGEHYITTSRSTGRYCVDATQRQRLDWEKHLALALERANRGDIDVVHLHDADAVEYFYKRMGKRRLPLILTLHVAAQESGLDGLHRQWAKTLLPPPVTCVAISHHQREQYRSLANVKNVVHHGIDIDSMASQRCPDTNRYLFSIGRITRGKGQDEAIELARRTGCKLIIAGCVQNKPEDRAYFASLKGSIDLTTALDGGTSDEGYCERVIKPLLANDKQIIYVGELNGEAKAHWYRNALATVFPIKWDEPFGLVVIESMAHGTPVIAFDRGAVPELIIQGKTGFVVNSMSAMVGAVGWVEAIDRAECRRHVSQHFSIATMTAGYSDLYRQVVQAQRLRSILLPVPPEAAVMAAPLVTCPI